MNNLLKEAIADAKSIRDFAIENAKQTMAENFTKQARSIVDSRLTEEEDLFTEEEEDLFAEAEAEATEDEEVLEIEDFDDTDEAEDAKIPEDEIEEVYEEDDELSEIIRELESELEEGESKDEDYMEEAEGSEMEEEEPKDSEESEDTSKKSVQEMIAELISEMESDDEDQPEDEEKEDTEKVVAELKSDLNEAYKTIKFLKSKMNEALLINSKLLYTGKLFRNFNLNESQKVTILETFDRASNVRETKLLYATLQTTLSGTKVSSKPNRLKESRASKPTGSTKSSGKAILAENQLVSRLQTLAGISTSK